MKCDTKQISRLVEHIRAGNPPKLPKGKFEELYLDRVVRSFGIRLTYTGAATWIVYYKIHGRQKRLTIGDVLELDREGAIKAAGDIRAKVRLGQLDPVAAKAEARRLAKIKFGDVAKQFLAVCRKKGLRPNTMRSYELILTGYYFEPFHNVPIDEITGEQINLRIEKITEQSGEASAWRANSPLKGMFRWAIKRKLFAGPSPMAQVDEPKKSDPRTRVFTDDEIRTLFKACDDWEAEVLADDARVAKGLLRTRAGKRSITDYARVMKLLFYTCCRAQEIADLKWSEIDWTAGELNIPASRIKTNTPLHQPLTESALTILKSVQRIPGRDYVFGQQGNKGRKYTGSGSGIDITGVNGKLDRRIAEKLKPALDEKEPKIRAMLAKDVPISKIRPAAHVNWHHIKRVQRKMAAEEAGTPIPAGPKLPDWYQEIKDWSAHTVRHTMRTRMGKIGIGRDIAERVLNHKGRVSAIEAQYDHYDYRTEKRQALERLEAHVNAIIGVGSEVVVPMPRRGRG
jgi:integrase